MLSIDQALERLNNNGITDSIQMVRRWLREGLLIGRRSIIVKKAGASTPTIWSGLFRHVEAMNISCKSLSV